MRAFPVTSSRRTAASGTTTAFGFSATTIRAVPNSPTPWPASGWSRSIRTGAVKSEALAQGQDVVDDARRGLRPSGQLDRGALPRPDSGELGLGDVGDEGEGCRVRERQDFLIVGDAIARGRGVRKDDPVGWRMQLGADQVALGQRAGAPGVFLLGRRPGLALHFPGAGEGRFAVARHDGSDGIPAPAPGRRP